MTTDHAILIAGFLIAAALVTHGYLTQSPRYQLLRQGENIALRIDTRTGDVALCGNVSGGFACIRPGH
jgi:hypothetical protein